MESATSYSADKALAEALAKLATMEEDNATLKRLVKEARTVNGTEGLEKLKERNKELMHVNSQWDLEYKQLDEAFRKYRIDSKQAQGESQALIAKLKDTKESMAAEIRELQAVITRKDKEVTDLRGKVRMLEDEVRSCHIGKPMVSQERVRELEEESHMLRQQIKAYQDDFNAERRDRERMNEKKEIAAVRYEAEVTSLRLQLERCRNELAHYTAEANRLSQQLRLKSQIEEEQYKRHLESNGYITRSPSGHLPPFDPFVDVDVDEELRRPPGRNSSSPRLLTRGVDLVQAYSNSQGAQASQRVGSELLDSERSRSPIMNGIGQSHRCPAPPVVTGTNAEHTNGRTNFRPNIPPSMTNGASTNAQQPAYHNGYTNGYNNSTSPSHNGPHVPVEPVRPVFEVTNTPPLQTKGKYSCPRCERKFESKRIWSDHKSRCIV